jgi:hypothetical protein
MNHYGNDLFSKRCEGALKANELFTHDWVHLECLFWFESFLRIPIVWLKVCLEISWQLDKFYISNIDWVCQQ